MKEFKEFEYCGPPPMKLSQALPKIGCTSSGEGWELAMAVFWGRLLGWSLGSNPRKAAVCCLQVSAGAVAESKPPSALSSQPAMRRLRNRPVGCIYSVQAVDQRFLLVAEERRQVPAAPSEHPPAFSEAAMPVLEASTRA